MPGPKSDKIWADAVRRAVLRRLENVEGKPQKIERLADNLVEWALEGKMDAVTEIANRLDGRPAQQLVHANDPENPLTSPQELTDEALAAIAAGGGAGTSAPTKGARKLN